MSSNLRNRVQKSFSFRLTLWYAAVSSIAFMVVFALAYHSLSSLLVKEDREAIRSKFDEYEDAYRRGGLTDLQAFLASERDSEKPILFFVRVANPENSTLLLSLPDQWRGIDLARIGDIDVDRKDQQVRARAREGETVFEILSFPLHDANVMQIGREIGRREELLARFRNVFIGILVPAVLLGLAGGYLLTFRALRPVRHLTKAVASITETGDIRDRVPLGTTEDELSGLVLLFNRMLERIENLVTGMEQSLDNVAHDLRTPMARFRGLAENALQQESLEACREALSDGIEESERIIRMLNTLMDIAEAKAGTLKLDREEVDVSLLAQEVIEVYRYSAEEKGITVGADLRMGLVVSADPDRMRQALGNLLDNGIKYTPAGGRVDVRAFAEEGRAIVTVKDTGIGIRGEDLPRVWDRLYRGDESRAQRGLGLGLSLVKSIVEIHGGWVAVSSEPGSGSVFSLSLPQSRQPF